jgi:hypothetical protein
MATQPHVGAAAQGQTAPEGPPNDEARELGSGAGLEHHETVSNLDSTSADAARKQFANAQARAALLGAALVQIEGDDGRPVCILSRGDWLREFVDQASVESVLAMMEGQR